ncbi:MAG: chitobiase/beta-hexosaminidase C-terminal domain-containing protein, partial [Prevotellaceae bacterium]|nr:chitobiase/beta-hexosaminidase C-terminal domain-containing protein [Prevotellaceae bacterium]
MYKLKIPQGFRFFLFLALLTLMPSLAQRASAEDVYLLTAENINGKTGNYNVPSNHKFTNTSGTVYTYTITSMPSTSFSFRIGVSRWEKQMQPYVNDAVLTINGSSYTITSDCFGSDKAWKVIYSEGEYSSLTITVDIGTTKTVKVTGTKASSSEGGSSSGGSTTTTVTKGDYYLVTNFVGGTTYTNGDASNSINYDRKIFKFKEQTDGSYSIDFPATVTGYAQILGSDGTNSVVYGPGQAAYGIHAATSSSDTGWPATGGTVPTSSSSLKSSSSLALNDNYWSFTTRNNGTANDDGMYTLNFKIDDSGTPTTWTITHNALKRVAYVVNSDMSESAQPLYDARTNASSGFDDKFLGSVYISPSKTYQVLGNYVINQSWISSAKSIDNSCINPSTTAPTINKLLLQGNGGNVWKQDNDYNLVYPNKSTFNPTSTSEGVYILEYNSSKGKDGGTYGMGGEIWLFSGAPTFNSVSMVGTAVDGTTTTSGSTTTWDYTSTAGDMTYDKTNHCYTLTLKTTAKDGATSFRFVANHAAATTWHEEDNTAANAARSPYDGTSTTGHTCTVNDPNTVSYVTSDDTETTDVNMLFNRPAGTWTVNFYIEATNVNNNAAYTYYYTINGTATPIYASVTPPTSTINYGEYVTPAVTVTDNNATSGSKLNYIYTLDGTEPTISSDGKTVNGTLVSYIPDAVITSNNPVGTLYMDGNGNIQEQGVTTSPITAGKTAVTIKAYAVKVQTVDGTTTYEAQGNLASATYTFKTAGGVSPTASYTISVSNDAGSDAVSVNKATATVTVLNKTTNVDDGVAVYYTTDGTDPSTSDTRHLVRNRKITVYALGQTVGSEQKIRVAIAGSAAATNDVDDGTTHASCKYDLTYSTSEGGYENYLNNDQDAKTLGGDGHVIIYVKPSDTSVKTYVYAYENITGTDGTTTAKLLTPMQPGRELTSNDQTTVNGETWYYLDAEPTSGYKEINLQISSASKTGYVTVANINKDVFLEFNTTTGVITDVTRAHTADNFYTTGAASGNTKDEAANPTADAPFVYVQVPAEWATSPNTVKILDSNDTEISGATYTKQNGAETSANSVCYKISGLTGLTSGTSTIKFAPYNTTSSSYGTLANHSFSTTYQNGGYYYYESSSVNGLGLVFTPTTGSEKDVRSTGHHDINHVTTGDQTNYLSKDWKYDDPTATTTTETVDDNWTGSSATVNDIAANTTISQTVSGLTPSTSYTVQMIVRGESGATGTLTLTGDASSNAKAYASSTTTAATDSKTFSGKNAAGTITTDGRVDALLSGTNNGWQKLEATANSSTDGTLKISLTAANEALQLSDVTLLKEANTDGNVWTRATTNNSTTEVDLSERKKANAFSFFDRGDNKNAIVYVNANTAEGMSENTINVATATTSDGTT